jgi:hypothetical protein
MSSNDPVDLTVDPKDNLPQAVIDNFLPNENKSILYLFQEYNKYPPHPSHYILPTNFNSFLHPTPVQEFDHQTLLQVPPPMLPGFSKSYQDAIKVSGSPTLSVTLQPQHSDPVTLPVWIFDYWVEIERVVKLRKQWKVAFTWVQSYSMLLPSAEICQSLLLGLSSFSWSHHAAYTRDITPLLSNSGMESFLNSFQIDHMVGRVGTEYEAQHGVDQAKHHIFATVDNFDAIESFYGVVHKKKDGYLWNALMEIENKIVTGEVNSFGGVMHLPLHWVSVVIDFQQLKIHYGDSFGDPMPKRKYKAFERWINHLVTRSSQLSGNITLGPLETGQQMDYISCGLFALNSIAHHYLNTPLLLSDKILLVGRRMEIALDIISTMTVCIFTSLQNYITNNNIVDLRWRYQDSN